MGKTHASTVILSAVRWAEPHVELFNCETYRNTGNCQNDTFIIYHLISRWIVCHIFFISFHLTSNQIKSYTCGWQHVMFLTFGGVVKSNVYVIVKRGLLNARSDCDQSIHTVNLSKVRGFIACHDCCFNTIYLQVTNVNTIMTHSIITSIKTDIFRDVLRTLDILLYIYVDTCAIFTATRKHKPSYSRLAK